MDKNSTKNGQFPALSNLKIAEKAIFLLKSTEQDMYTFKMISEEYINLKKKIYLRRC
jgi:hypothetical protein